jgi:hypothetical protein
MSRVLQEHCTTYWPDRALALWHCMGQCILAFGRSRHTSWLFTYMSMHQ